MIYIDGKHHTLFAPVFSFGVFDLMVNNGIVNNIELSNSNTIIILLTSVLFATAPDADLYTGYPLRIILGMCRHKNGYSVARHKKYKMPNNIITRFFAVFFKLIGVSSHRDWRTHSPLLYGALGFFILNNLEKLTNSQNQKVILIGIILSIWGHIVADIFSKGGVPIGPDNHRYSITKTIFGNHLSNLFKSDGEFYFLIILFLMLFLFYQETTWF